MMLNPIWHRMLYSGTHMPTVGVKGLSEYSSTRYNKYSTPQKYW